MYEIKFTDHSVIVCSMLPVPIDVAWLLVVPSALALLSILGEEQAAADT